MAHGSAISSRALAFHDEMRAFCESHGTWTERAIVDFVGGAPDTPAVIARVLKNQMDIGDAVKAYNGRKAAMMRPRECGPARCLPGPSRSPAPCAQSSGHGKRPEPLRETGSPIPPRAPESVAPLPSSGLVFKVDFRQHAGGLAGQGAEQPQNAGTEVNSRRYLRGALMLVSAGVDRAGGFKAATDLGL
jgi:hypothetical protein